MKTCCACKERKPFGDFPKDRTKPDGLQYRCKPCARKKNADWYAANPGKGVEYSMRWREQNPEKFEAYRQSVADKQPAYHRERYERMADEIRAHNRQWHKKNPAAHTALCARRRAAQRLRYPAWANKAAILELYKEARRLTSETGVVHEVDHILPLQGKTVSGLHVHTNLRVITRPENRRKSAKFVEALVAGV